MSFQCSYIVFCGHVRNGSQWCKTGKRNSTRVRKRDCMFIKKDLLVYGIGIYEGIHKGLLIP